jgi:hypothetical protein
MRVLSAIIALTTLGTTFASTAHAQDYKFTVPVEVSKAATNVRTFTVFCDVGDDGMGQLRSEGRGASAPQALDASGSFTGEVTVAITTPWDRHLVAHPMYRCRIYLTAIDPQTKTTLDYFRDESPLWNAAAAGVVQRPRSFPTASPPVLEAKGPLPRP